MARSVHLCVVTTTPGRQRPRMSHFGVQVLTKGVWASSQSVLSLNQRLSIRLQDQAAVKGPPMQTVSQYGRTRGPYSSLRLKWQIAWLDRRELSGWCGMQCDMTFEAYDTCMKLVRQQECWSRICYYRAVLHAVKFSQVRRSDFESQRCLSTELSALGAAKVQLLFTSPGRSCHFYQYKAVP